MVESGKVYRFPSGFLWGAATSSHQVEGDNRWSDWWEYEQTGRMPFLSGQACRHYDLYEKDFDMAASWGHNAHRFSIEWSRIQPEENRWNPDAIEHYRDVVRALRRRGLEPVVTLHHFTNPAWFLRRGGWVRRDSARLFAAYAEYVVQRLGSDVRYWITVNEPTVYVKYGYVTGGWPPCLRGSVVKAVLAWLNLAQAHNSAYRILHQYRRDARVGIAHSAPFIVPCDPANRFDRIAAGVRNFILNRLLFCSTGGFPSAGRSRSRNLDFLGINYYSRTIVRRSARGFGLLVGEECRENHHGSPRSFSDIGWEIHPPGLKGVLENFSSFGLPIFITENGVATEDESLREAFLRQHLLVLTEALEAGANVIGYFYWSLMDNFEWALGTQARFGLAAVDFQTQERTARPCATFYASVCRTNVLLQDADRPRRERSDSI
jgi:beta-glucosidase